MAFGYVALIWWVMNGWDETVEWEEPPSDYIPSTDVTVVVAARNEAKTIEDCLQSILQQDIPADLLHIIVVDDQSTDETSSIVTNISDSRITLLHTAHGNEGKKAAISQAVANSTSQVILCTDADSKVGRSWVRTFLYQYELNKPRLIVGPIVYETDRSLLQRFQYMDGIGNTAVAANGILHGAYHMANGANLFYERSLFEEVGGYDGDKVASGDDMLLVQKASAVAPESIRFLKAKSAVVKTAPVESIGELIAQRKRWATKSKHYSDKGILKVQGFVFAVVLMLVLNLVLIPLTDGFSLFSFLFLAFVKGCMDYLLLSRMADWFGDSKPLKSFVGAFVYFTLYILWAGWSALVPTHYTWKGRQQS